MHEVVSRRGESSNVYKSVRNEVEIDTFDAYSTVKVEVTAIDSEGFQRVAYSRVIVVSALSRETRI